MRKPRDYDSELQALSGKAKQLKDRKLHQLGELVIATGADALPIEQLAGALLSAIDTKDASVLDGWRKRGAAFFRTAPRSTRGAAKHEPSVASGAGSGPPAPREDRA